MKSDRNLPFPFKFLFYSYPRFLCPMFPKRFWIALDDSWESLKVISFISSDHKIDYSIFSCNFTETWLTYSVIHVGLPWWLKESACQCRSYRRFRFNSCVRKITWRRKWQPTPVLLPGKSHGQRSLEAHSPWHTCMLYILRLYGILIWPSYISRW